MPLVARRKVSQPFIKNVILDTLFIAIYSRVVIAVSAWIDLYTIAANIYIRRNIRAYTAKGLILYGTAAYSSPRSTNAQMPGARHT